MLRYVGSIVQFSLAKLTTSLVRLGAKPEMCASPDLLRDTELLKYVNVLNCLRTSHLFSYPAGPL